MCFFSLFVQSRPIQWSGHTISIEQNWSCRLNWENEQDCWNECGKKYCSNEWTNEWGWNKCTQLRIRSIHPRVARVHARVAQVYTNCIHSVNSKEYRSEQAPTKWHFSKGLLILWRTMRFAPSDIALCWAAPGARNSNCTTLCRTNVCVAKTRRHVYSLQR